MYRELAICFFRQINLHIRSAKRDADVLVPFSILMAPDAEFTVADRDRVIDTAVLLLRADIFTFSVRSAQNAHIAFCVLNMDIRVSYVKWSFYR